MNRIQRIKGKSLGKSLGEIKGKSSGFTKTNLWVKLKGNLQDLLRQISG